MSGVVHVDSASCGFPAPTRRYGERFDRAAE
jgi:glutamate/tyrosine decarboxylase-like PLP-dependent enzyme